MGVVFKLDPLQKTFDWASGGILYIITFQSLLWKDPQVSAFLTYILQIQKQECWRRDYCNSVSSLRVLGEGKCLSSSKGKKILSDQNENRKASIPVHPGTCLWYWIESLLVLEIL